MRSGELVSPHSGDVTSRVGEGWELKAAHLMKSLASRPRADLSRPPMAASIRAARAGIRMIWASGLS